MRRGHEASTGGKDCGGVSTDKSQLMVCPNCNSATAYRGCVMRAFQLATARATSTR